MSALEKNPDVLASNTDEEFGPGTDWRGIPRGPSQHTWRLDYTEATQERVPEVPVVTREEPAATVEKPGGSLLQAR